VDITVVDGSNDITSGIGWALLCILVVGEIAPAVALVLRTRGRTHEGGWPPTWHTPLTIVCVFQLCSVIVATLLFLAAALIAPEIWIPGLFLANVLWTAVGAVLWRGFRLSIAATVLPSVTGRT